MTIANTLRTFYKKYAEPANSGEKEPVVGEKQEPVVGETKDQGNGETKESTQPGSSKEFIAKAKPKLAKKYDDVLASDTQMAGLLVELVEAKQGLAGLLKEETSTAEDRETAYQKLAGVHDRIEERQKQLNAEGKSGVAKAPRAKDLKDETRESDLHGKNPVYYADTPEKRAESAVRVDDKGRLVDAKGKVLPDGVHGYVQSAEDGSRHVFDSSETATKEKKKVHHSSEVAGGAVLGAGEQTIKDGLLREVTDKSGHYKPEGDMTHQYVEGLVKDGVKMRDDTVVAVGADGKMRQATSQEVAAYQKVQKLPALKAERAKLDDKTAEGKEKAAELDKAIKPLEAIQAMLLKNGVGPRQKEATVQVFKSTTLFNEEEWEMVKGKKEMIKAAIIEKLGMNLGGKPFPDSFPVGTALDPNDMGKTNDHIGVIMRAADFAPEAGYVDKDEAYIRSGVDQFLQTGGNTDAMVAKRDVNAELLESEKTGLAREIFALGGDAALQKLGLDPSQFSPTQQLSILETPNVLDKLAQLGFKSPAALPADKFVELAETPDGLFQTFVKLGGVEKLSGLGIDTSKLSVLQQVSYLENPDLLQKLTELKNRGLALDEKSLQGEVGGILREAAFEKEWPRRELRLRMENIEDEEDLDELASKALDEGRKRIIEALEGLEDPTPENVAPLALEWKKLLTSLGFSDAAQEKDAKDAEAQKAFLRNLAEWNYHGGRIREMVEDSKDASEELIKKCKIFIQKNGLDCKLRDIGVPGGKLTRLEGVISAAASTWDDHVTKVQFMASGPPDQAIANRCFDEIVNAAESIRQIQFNARQKLEQMVVEKLERAKAEKEMAASKPSSDSGSGGGSNYSVSNYSAVVGGTGDADDYSNDYNLDSDDDDDDDDFGFEDDEAEGK
jgi:hypothetical protein